MINESRFSKACVEALEVITKLPKEDYSKIDNSFIEVLQKNKDKNYSFELNPDKSMEEQNILKETKNILAYVFLNYLATKEEKEIVTKKLQKDVMQAEMKKREKYPTNVFERNELKNG